MRRGHRRPTVRAAAYAASLTLLETLAGIWRTDAGSGGTAVGAGAVGAAVVAVAATTG